MIKFYDLHPFRVPANPLYPTKDQEQEAAAVWYKKWECRSSVVLQEAMDGVGASSPVLTLSALRQCWKNLDV